LARTAPVALNEMLGAMFGVSWGPLFAAAALHLLPILVLIWLFQNVLIEGTGYGADK
jgi:ABC-type glycerol-3-phosphate transport system permease component